MARTLFFEQIVDSRLDDGNEGELLQALKDRNKKITADLNAMGLFVTVTEPVRITWPDGYQFRSSFAVRKGAARCTWNDVYGAINRHKAAKYRFI